MTWKRHGTSPGTLTAAGDAGELELLSLGRMLHIPVVVAEIPFGNVLGKSLLKLEFAGDWLPFLAELGFLLLMFRAGMKIDFATLRIQNHRQTSLHFVVFAATLADFLALFGITFYLLWIKHDQVAFGVVCRVRSLAQAGAVLGVVVPQAGRARSGVDRRQPGDRRATLHRVVIPVRSTVGVGAPGVGARDLPGP